nr:hypothetical protein [Tanacetum cinerariifolium]
MHNNIMASGLRDRPPMPATGIYAQWQLRFIRYIYTRPNGDALRKCLLQGPYKLSTVIVLEKEAIHLLLTGIEDEIYSTVDACKTAHEMKPKRVKDYTYHKEKLLLCKQAEKGIPLQAEQVDWLEDIDEEKDEQELEAHYSFMAKIQAVLLVNSGSDAKPLEKAQYDVEYNVFGNEK